MDLDTIFQLNRIQEENIEVKNYLRNTHLILMTYAILNKIPAKDFAKAIGNHSAIKKYEADFIAELNKLNPEKKRKSLDDVVKEAKKDL